MKLSLKKGLMSAVLLLPMAIVPAVIGAASLDDEHRDDHRFHDRKHNDDHEWNDREDRAYKMWVQERHRKYENFDKLKDRDRENYWQWRHNHSDALLKIDIH